MSELVKVELEWAQSARFEVHDGGGVLHVRADPRLSHAQVTAACADLGEVGPLVLQAWRERVGLL